QRRAVVKAHKSRGEILHIKIRGKRRVVPRSKLPRTMSQVSVRHAAHRDGRRIPHEPQRQVKNMHADVNARAAPAVLLENKAWRRDEAIAPQHPTTRMVDLPQYARLNFALHRLRYAFEAKVLCGHQPLAASIPRLNHAPDLFWCWRQGFLADHM